MIQVKARCRTWDSILDSHHLGLDPASQQLVFYPVSNGVDAPPVSQVCVGANESLPCTALGCKGSICLAPGRHKISWPHRLSSTEAFIQVTNCYLCHVVEEILEWQPGREVWEAGTSNLLSSCEPLLGGGSDESSPSQIRSFPTNALPIRV